MTKASRPSSWTKKFPLRPWIIWFLSAFFMFYKYALEVSPSVMTQTLMQSFHISGTQLGNFAANYFYAYLIWQIPAGVLIDRFGPRKVTTLAILVCSLGGFLFSGAESVWIACLGRFLTGTGAAFAAINSAKLISTWFPPKKFALMLGLMMSVAMLGAVMGQAPLASYIESIDWRDAIFQISLIGVIFAAVFVLIVKDKSPSSAEVKKAPKVSQKKALLAILKNSQSMWLSFYSGFAFAPVMVFGGLWGVEFIMKCYHLDKNISAQLVSLIFVGFAVGAPTIGWFSGKINKRKPCLFWGTLIAALSLSALIYVPNLSSNFLALLLFIFGFSISSFLLSFSMIKELNPIAYAATAIGFMNAFDAFFGAFSDPLTGKILDFFWDGSIENGSRNFSVSAYKLAFLTLPIYLGIAVLTLFKIKETGKHKDPVDPLP